MQLLRMNTDDVCFHKGLTDPVLCLLTLLLLFNKITLFNEMRSDIIIGYEYLHWLELDVLFVPCAQGKMLCVAPKTDPGSAPGKVCSAQRVSRGFQSVKVADLSPIPAPGGNLDSSVQ